MAGAGRTENWIYFLTTLAIVFCVAEAHFTIQQESLNFDKALQACQPDGFLANMASLEEVQEILEVISNTLRHTSLTWMSDFNYWIGLKSGRDDCVVPDQPLRGFKWEVDIRSNPEVGQWKTEPVQTCTGTRCALLSGEFNGTAVVSWGLLSSSCRSSHPIVCKKGKAGDQNRHCPIIDIPNALSLNTNSDGTQTVECWTGEMHILMCSADTQRWTRSDFLAVDENICPSCKAGYERDASGSCVEVDECKKKACEHCSNNVCFCFDNSGNVHEEGSPLCSAFPATTVAPEGGAKLHDILTKVNTPTPEVSILERPSTSSLPDSPKAPASPEAPASPTDDSQVHVEAQTNVFIPVLIAVMALVVLVVVTLAVVKCCLRSRSQKLALKKAEQMAMKRAEASKDTGLKAQDSMEHTNEKEGT